MNLTVGTRIRYTGDMANDEGKGEISAVSPCGFYGTKYDVTLDDEDDRRLPALEKGDRVKLLAIKPEQHFTEPPPRYSEASLVKALEEYGIGRPSTYASIIQTLLFKKYCELVSRRFVPTDLGKIVNRFLTGNFERYVDFGFTAAMEDELDNISRGEEEWVPVLERFWIGFKKQIDDVEENVTRSDVAMARDIGLDAAARQEAPVFVMRDQHLRAALARG
jgi:DNA topoisomerase-1